MRYVTLHFRSGQHKEIKLTDWRKIRDTIQKNEFPPSGWIFLDDIEFSVHGLEFVEYGDFDDKK